MKSTCNIWIINWPVSHRLKRPYSRSVMHERSTKSSGVNFIKHLTHFWRSKHQLGFFKHQNWCSKNPIFEFHKQILMFLNTKICASKSIYEYQTPKLNTNTYLFKHQSDKGKSFFMKSKPGFQNIKWMLNRLVAKVAGHPKHS